MQIGPRIPRTNLHGSVIDVLVKQEEVNYHFHTCTRTPVSLFDEASPILVHLARHIDLPSLS